MVKFLSKYDRIPYGKDYKILVLERHGVPIGWALGMLRTYALDQWEWFYYVKISERGKGFGKLLVTKSLQTSKTSTIGVYDTEDIIRIANKSRNKR